MENLTPVIIGAIFTFIFGLLGLIYGYLNKKADENVKSINHIKDKYATKEDLNTYKEDHNREHDKQDKAIERLEKKIDELIKLVLGGSHEK